VWKTLALQSCPRPGGVDLLKMISPVQLMRQFEVMEDSKDRLGNFHERWLLSEAMLADESARFTPVSIRMVKAVCEPRFLKR
jgi:hypothetical protein